LASEAELSAIANVAVDDEVVKAYAGLGHSGDVFETKTHGLPENAPAIDQLTKGPLDSDSELK